jgi:excisionase family DNA binding protein
MTATIHEVLTLEEAADYLRLPVETIEREAARGRIPGRRIEDTWRFLKSAIDEWLRDWESRGELFQGQPDELDARRVPDSREVLLRQAGALGDDESLSELRDSIYAKRGRPETESEKGS